MLTKLSCLLMLLLSPLVWAGMTFDGVDDSINMGNIPAWNFSNQTVTISLWVQSASATSQYLIARRLAGGGSSVGGWFVRLNADGTLTVRMLDSAGAPAGQRTTVSTSLTNGVRHHIAVVATTNTTTAAGNDAQIYLDGVQDAGVYTAGSSPYVVCTGTCPLMLGAESDGVEPLNGTLEAVALYTVGLTLSEIQTLAKSDLILPQLTRPLAAHWPLDDCPDGTSGQGVTVRDRSGNHLDGTGTGTTCRGSARLTQSGGAY